MYKIQIPQSYLGLLHHSGEDQDSAGLFHKFSSDFFAHLESLFFSFLKRTEGNTNVSVSSLMYCKLVIPYITSLTVTVCSRDRWKFIDQGCLWGQNYFLKNTKALLYIFYYHSLMSI